MKREYPKRLTPLQLLELLRGNRWHIVDGTDTGPQPAGAWPVMEANLLRDPSGWHLQLVSLYTNAFHFRVGNFMAKQTAPHSIVLGTITMTGTVDTLAKVEKVTLVKVYCPDLDHKTEAIAT